MITRPIPRIILIPLATDSTIGSIESTVVTISVTLSQTSIIDASFLAVKLTRTLSFPSQHIVDNFLRAAHTPYSRVSHIPSP